MRHVHDRFLRYARLTCALAAASLVPRKSNTAFT
jgi:hypothetical protein